MCGEYKRLARSNDRIKNYDCCRKPGLLRFLRQNLNLTLLGSYHKVEPYHQVFFFIGILFLLDPFKKKSFAFFFFIGSFRFSFNNYSLVLQN
jgi:hypothetical protein